MATANLKGDQEQASKSAPGPARTCHRPWQGSKAFASLCGAEFQPCGAFSVPSLGSLCLAVEGTCRWAHQGLGDNDSSRRLASGAAVSFIGTFPVF